MKRLTIESFKNPHASTATAGRNTVYYSCVGSHRDEQDLLLHSVPEDSLLKGEAHESADTRAEETEETKDNFEYKSPTEKSMEKKSMSSLSRFSTRRPNSEFKAIQEAQNGSLEESFYEANSGFKGQQASISEDQKLRASELKTVLPNEDNKGQEEGSQQEELKPEYAEWLRIADEGIEQIKAVHEQGPEGLQKIYEEKKKKHGLVIYLGSYKDKDGWKINRSRSEWTVPCTASQFLKFMADYEEQKKLDKNIDTWTHLDVFGQTEEKCCFTYYLAYKKVLICDPRDFVYLKYYKKVGENVWCDVSKSISHKDYPEFKNKVRGEVILVGYMVTEYVDQETGRTYSKVKLYSENNFKMNIPDFIAKTFASTEMKGFVENCIKRICEIHGLGDF